LSTHRAVLEWLNAGLWTNHASNDIIRPMSQMHPTALIGAGSSIGLDNIIGPHVIIEEGVKIGNRNHIMAGAYIARGTEISDDNQIHMNAVIGHTPQDIAFQGKDSFTKIGCRNIIREFVTIHRGTKEGSSTVIGDNNFIMAYCHIAHNCQLGNKITLVNQASLTGYCIVEDNAFLSGMTGLHQFTRVGKLSLLSALSAVNKDIPPYMICGGRPAVVLGINVVGLRRNGFDAATREEIRQCYKLLYRSGLNVTQALAEIKKRYRSEAAAHLVRFIEDSDRGILDGAAGGEEDGEDILKAKKA